MLLSLNEIVCYVRICCISLIRCCSLHWLGFWRRNFDFFLQQFLMKSTNSFCIGTKYIPTGRPSAYRRCLCRFFTRSRNLFLLLFAWPVALKTLSAAHRALFLSSTLAILFSSDPLIDSNKKTDWHKKCVHLYTDLQFVFALVVAHCKLSIGLCSRQLSKLIYFILSSCSTHPPACYSESPFQFTNKLANSKHRLFSTSFPFSFSNYHVPLCCFVGYFCTKFYYIVPAIKIIPVTDELRRDAQLQSKKCTALWATQ